MKRGEIRFENVDAPQRYGVINSHRPVVVIGTNGVEAIQVIPLTTHRRSTQGCCARYHVPIQSTGHLSLAMVEQIRTVFPAELSNSILCNCTEDELCAIGQALEELLDGSGAAVEKRETARKNLSLSLQLIQNALELVTQ